MSFTLFSILLIAAATVSVLLTEAEKKFCENAKKEYSANLMALVNAVILGGGGMILVYIYMGIRFDVINIASIICMMICCWLGAMIGYDKVIQLVSQIKGLSKK